MTTCRQREGVYGICATHDSDVWVCVKNLTAERDEARRNEGVVNGWRVEVGQRASELLDYLGDIAEVVGLYRDETGPDLIERARALRAQLATLTARVAVLEAAARQYAFATEHEVGCGIVGRCTCKSLTLVAMAHADLRAALSTPPAEESR